MGERVSVPVKRGTQGNCTGSICSSDVVSDPGVQHAGDCLLRTSV